MIGKKHSGKADQSTLASEHAQLFSVVINWGNKIKFDLYVNMAGFCSDSHIWPQKFIAIKFYGLLLNCLNKKLTDFNFMEAQYHT